MGVDSDGGRLPQSPDDSPKLTLACSDDDDSDVAMDAGDDAQDAQLNLAMSSEDDDNHGAFENGDDDGGASEAVGQARGSGHDGGVGGNLRLGPCLNHAAIGLELASDSSDADDSLAGTSDDDSYVVSPPTAPSSRGRRNMASEVVDFGTELWPHVLLETLENLLSAPVLRRSFFYQPVRISTTFSGIGTPEMAAVILSQAAQEVLGRPLRWTFAAACEVSARKRAKLLAMGSKDQCVFKDITDVCKSWASAAPASLGNYEAICKIVARDRGCDTHQCDRHRTHCPWPKVVGDIAGSPCTPWSKAGPKLGRNHKLIHLLVIWCHWVRRLQLQWAIHENVYGFDSQILQDLLSDMYDIILLKVNPTTHGMLIRRPRLYAVLLLKGTLQHLANVEQVYAAITNAFQAQHVRHPYPSSWSLHHVNC